MFEIDWLYYLGDRTWAYANDAEAAERWGNATWWYLQAHQVLMASTGDVPA